MPAENRKGCEKPGKFYYHFILLGYHRIRVPFKVENALTSLFTTRKMCNFRWIYNVGRLFHRESENLGAVTGYIRMRSESVSNNL